MFLENNRRRRGRRPHWSVFIAAALFGCVTDAVWSISPFDSFYNVVVASEQSTLPQVQSDDERLPDPPSGHAPYIAGIARDIRLTRNACEAPFRRVVVPASPGDSRGPAVPATFSCVLDADATAVDTFLVESFTSIDCRGHILTPSTLGVPGDLSRRSDPEVAFFLNESYGVKISNCVIEGFDFGVFGTNNKIGAEIRSDAAALATFRNRIVSNVINVRFYPIYFYLTDNTEIRDNAVSFTSPSGLGISTFFDSDLNTIKDNVITGGTSNADSAPAVPGPVIPGGSNPSFSSPGAGITVAHFATNPSLVSAVVGGQLFQITVPNPVSDPERSEDNFVDGNTIAFDPAAPTPALIGIGSSQAVRSVITRNTVHRGNVGIVLPGAVGPKTFPGRCSLDASRLCLIANDCNIPVFDLQPKGMCVGTTTELASLPTKDALVEENTLVGPFNNFGLNVPNVASRVMVRGNWIAGPATGGGLRLAGPSLETGNAVVGNRVSNFTNALRLEKSTAASFDATFSLNDFTGYTTAVITSNDYDLPTELSVNGLGNYWGLSCPGFDPNLVKRLNTAVNPYVADSHAFGVPVAGVSGLPAPCQ